MMFFANGVHIPRRGMSGLLYCAKPPPVIPDSRHGRVGGRLCAIRNNDATDAHQSRNNYATSAQQIPNRIFQPTKLNP